MEGAAGRSVWLEQGKAEGGVGQPGSARLQGQRSGSYSAFHSECDGKLLGAWSSDRFFFCVYI